MSRIPTASRESVSQYQVDAFATLVASRGSVPDIGPVAIMINNSELATRGEHFRAYFRGYEITLEAPVRELAMIFTAPCVGQPVHLERPLRFCPHSRCAR